MCLAVDPSSRLLAAGYHEKLIRIYDALSGVELDEIDGMLNKEQAFLLLRCTQELTLLQFAVWHGKKADLESGSYLVRTMERSRF